MRIAESALRRMVRSEILREADEQMSLPFPMGGVPGNNTMGGVPGKYTYEIKRFETRDEYISVRVYKGDRQVAGINIDQNRGHRGPWEINSHGYDNAPRSLRVFLWTLGIEIATLLSKGAGAVPEEGLYASDVYDADVWRLFMSGESGVNAIALKKSPWEKTSQYRYRYVKSPPTALIQLKNSGLLTADSYMPPGI